MSSEWDGNRNEEWSAATDLGDEVLAIASHDLRAPITVVKAQAQLLRRSLEQGTATQEVIDAGLASIVSQADHLSRPG